MSSAGGVAFQPLPSRAGVHGAHHARPSAVGKSVLSDVPTQYANRDPTFDAPTEFTQVNPAAIALQERHEEKPRPSVVAAATALEHSRCLLRPATVVAIAGLFLGLCALIPGLFFGIRASPKVFVYSPASGLPDER